MNNRDFRPKSWSISDRVAMEDDRNSYMLYGMVPLSMTLNDPNQMSSAHFYSDVEYLRKSTIYILPIEY